MAEKAQAKQEEEREPTRRVVLKREQVIVLPEGMSEEDVHAVTRAVAETKKVKVQPKAFLLPVEAWTVVGEFEGASKDKAIEAHAGKPGTPDAKVGAFKAPTASAWAGGALYTAPPKPLVVKEAID